MTITSTSALLFSQGNLNTVWPWNSWQHSNAERNETTRDDHLDFVPGPHALSHLRIAQCTITTGCYLGTQKMANNPDDYINPYKSIQNHPNPIWRDEKAVSREKSQKRKDQKKEDAGARKGRKVAKHCVFSWFCGSGGLKSRLAKAAGAETSGEMRDEKLHAVVARSRFRSEKVQNTSASDHFWKLRC